MIFMRVGLVLATLAVGSFAVFAFAFESGESEPQRTRLEDLATCKHSWVIVTPCWIDFDNPVRVKVARRKGNTEINSYEDHYFPLRLAEGDIGPVVAFVHARGQLKSHDGTPRPVEGMRRRHGALTQDLREALASSATAKEFCVIEPEQRPMPASALWGLAGISVLLALVTAYTFVRRA